MKRLLLIVFILLSIGVKAQTYNPGPGVPTGSTSFSPPWRYLDHVTDSLRNFYMLFGTKSYQIYTAAQVNNLLNISTVHTSNGISGNGSVGSPVGLGGTLTAPTVINYSVSDSLKFFDPSTNSGLFLKGGVINIIENSGSFNTTLGTSPGSYSFQVASGSNNTGITNSTSNGLGILDQIKSIGITTAADYSTNQRLQPNALASIKAVKLIGDSIKATISAGGVTSFNSRIGAVVPVAGDYASLAETLTGKTISGAANTLSNIGNSSLTNSTISGVSLGASLFAHTPGFGLSGSNYDGHNAQTWIVDSTAMATKYYASVVVGADGIVTGMSPTTISGTTATTPSGIYRLNNLLITKGSSTNTTIDAQDASKNRYDLIVGDSSGALSMVSGVLNTDAVQPDVPANKALIASIYIPSVASGGTVSSGGGNSKGTTANALNSGYGIIPFSFNGGTSGVKVVTDSTKLQTITNFFPKGDTRYQKILTLTTTGSSGAATLSGGTLNIPQYSGASAANPTASIGFTAVNGSVTTFIRSDGAPKADSTVIRSVANSYSLSGMQTKLNNYALTSSLPVGANPTATAGATAINGTSAAFMRADAAPKVDSTIFQTITNFFPKGDTRYYKSSNPSGYITGNQSISFAPTGDVTGSTTGTTSLTPALSIGVGKVTNSMLAGSIDLTSKVTGLLPVANGGTGTATPGIVAGTNITVTGTWPNQTINGSASGVASFSAGSTGFTPNTATTGAIILGGTLGISNGGTGVTSVTTTPTASAFAGWDANKNFSANSFLQGYTSTATASATTTLTVSSTVYQEFTGTLSQTVQLPAVSTLVIGQQFIVRNSSASNSNIVVNSSGGNTIVTLLQGQIARVTCISTSGTGAGSWQLDLNAFNSNSNSLNLNGGNLTANIGTFSTVGASTFRGINATQAVLNSSVTTGGTYGFILNMGTSGGTISNSSLIATPFAITQTYNQTGTAGSTDFTINRTETALGSSAHKFASFQVATVEKWAVDNKGNEAATSVRGTAVTFANVPSPAVEGMLVGVTDSSTATYGATITGGGSNHVLAYYNGTNWTVH